MQVDLSGKWLQTGRNLNARAFSKILSVIDFSLDELNDDLLNTRLNRFFSLCQSTCIITIWSNIVACAWLLAWCVRVYMDDIYRYIHSVFRSGWMYLNMNLYKHICVCVLYVLWNYLYAIQEALMFCVLLKVLMKPTIPYHDSSIVAFKYSTYALYYYAW